MKHVTQVLATGSSAVGEPRHRKLWTNTGSGLSEGLDLKEKGQIGRGAIFCQITKPFIHMI